MSATSRIALLMAASAMFAMAPRAHADEPAPQPASADAAAAAQGLFVEGRHLVAEKRYAEGCAKLEQSQRLDPAAGTQVNLADCYERGGKFASAWIEFHEAAAAAQRKGRAEWAEEARERARILEPSVPKLTVIVDEPVPGLEVRRGGAWIEPSTYGSPIPVDPGSYEITAKAPQSRAWSTRVTVEAGAHVVLHVPSLVEQSPGAAPEAATTPGSNAISPDRSSGRVQRTVALTLGATAIVWTGAGAYLGLTAIFDNNEAGWRCPTSPRCTDQRAVTLTNSARRAADASTISFIAGGVFLSTAATLYFTAPNALGRASITLGAGPSNVSLGARW